jgi:hypothetical protein
LETGVNLNQEADLTETRQTFRLQGDFKEALKNNPVVVKFPGLAGSSHMVNEDADMDDATAAETHNNPFSPFLSKLEWEVA